MTLGGSSALSCARVPRFLAHPVAHEDEGIGLIRLLVACPLRLAQAFARVVQAQLRLPDRSGGGVEVQRIPRLEGVDQAALLTGFQTIGNLLSHAHDPLSSLHSLTPGVLVRRRISSALEDYLSARGSEVANPQAPI